jgi:hypothetical protein
MPKSPEHPPAPTVVADVVTHPGPAVVPDGRVAGDDGDRIGGAVLVDDTVDTGGGAEAASDGEPNRSGSTPEPPAPPVDDVAAPVDDLAEPAAAPDAGQPCHRVRSEPQPDWFRSDVSQPGDWFRPGPAQPEVDVPPVPAAPAPTPPVGVFRPAPAPRHDRSLPGPAPTVASTATTPAADVRTRLARAGAVSLVAVLFAALAV